MKLSASSPRVVRAGKKEDGMSRHARSSTTSKLTTAQRRKLEAIAAMPDGRIDFSDIPELPEKFWENAVPNPFYRPVKQQLILRLDSDVIAWLKQQGTGYQTRLNALLRGAMLKDLKKSA